MRSYHLVGRKIVGVGQNYACHAKEMGCSTMMIGAVAGKETTKNMMMRPSIFLKPPSSYVLQPNPIRIPDGHECHHEVELGVVIGKSGANISKDVAMSYVAGFSLALDITARDLQSKAKQEGQPWAISKGFDTFCPVSSYIPKESLSNYANVDLWLRVNGTLRQHGNTGDMIMGIPALIEYISSIMRLERGDLILTGTPKGVGPIAVGDEVTAGIGHDIVRMNFRVVPKPKKMKN